MNKLNKDLLTDSLNDAGALSIRRLFVEMFGEYPDTYAFSLNEKQKVDLLKINSELIKKVFPEVKYFWTTVSESAVSTSSVDDPEEITDDEPIYFNSHYSDAVIEIITDQCCWGIYNNQIIVYYKNKSVDEIKDLLKTVVEQLPFKKCANASAKVKLVCSDGRDYYTMESSIKPTTIDITATYNDDFLNESQKVVDFLNSRESGLVLLHGKAGSGKTTFIRHLITNVPKEYIIIPPGMMPHIVAPEFISFIMNHKDSVFILEDCESLLIDRNVAFNSGISTILNMSDGILSDIFNLKFICTFNADMSTIDTALTRPGRCYANYEFGLLCKEKVEKLIELNKIESVEPKDMLIADLFNISSVEQETKSEETRKIGF